MLLFRSRMLMSLINEGKVNTSEIKQLFQLVRKTFGLKKMAKGIISQLNPLSN